MNNKKNFKDNTVNIDRFFSDAQTQNIQSADYTGSTADTQKKPYRINLKLRPQFRQYLDNEAWKARKSISEYLNDLIQEDMEKKNEDNK